MMTKAHTFWLMSCLLLLSGCVNRHFYREHDYSFYKGAGSGGAELPRTDGVYVLQTGSVVSAQPQIYKFYCGGQVNLILAGADRLPADSLINLVNAEAVRQQTHFQGYYRMKGKQVVVQRVNSALRRFTYDYFLIEGDRLVHVSSGIDGRGRFREKQFQTSYRAVYKFTPLPGSFSNPVW